MEAYNKWIKENSTISDEKKDHYISLIEKRLEEKCKLKVIYKSNCICHSKVMRNVDHFPIKDKVVGDCPQCTLVGILEISEPIQFYMEILNKYISLEELNEALISPEYDEEDITELYKKFG